MIYLIEYPKLGLKFKTKRPDEIIQKIKSIFKTENYTLKGLNK